MNFDFEAVLVDWGLLVRGVAWTLGLTAIATPIGMFVGVVCACARVWGSVPLRIAAGIYVELIRNTPFIVQLFFIFFGLPAVGLKLNPEIAAVIAMVLNLGAYSTEITRAGLEATPKGQIEAAQSLALSPLQVLVRIVLPPALRRVWPAMVSQIIIVMLGSSVCSQISVEDLTYAANLIQSRNFRAFEAFLIATAIYLALSFVLRWILNWLGPRLLFGR